MAAVCRDANVCTEAMKEISATMDPLTEGVKASQDAFTGSLEEREALDKASIAQVKASKLLTTLEEQMVPAGYITPVPSQYADLPQLQQRATVEMVIKKAESGAQFDIDGVNFPEAKMKMVIDGYTCTFYCLHDKLIVVVWCGICTEERNIICYHYIISLTTSLPQLFLRIHSSHPSI